MAPAGSGERAHRDGESGQARGPNRSVRIAEPCGERASVGVLRADAAGNCFWVNDAGCRVLGASREALLGRGWLHFLPELGLAGALHSPPKSAAGDTMRGERCLRRPDGREVLLQVDWMPDLDAQGRHGGVLCTLLDVTTQRRGEEEAREAHDTALRQLEEIEVLYRNAPAALCMVDRELRFVRVNRWMALFDQRTEEEHIGRKMEEVIPQAARAQAVAIARRVLDSGEAVTNVEVHTISPRDPSREHWWLVSCHPLRRGGEVSGLLTVIQNATAIKRAELEARRRVEELEAVYRNSPVGLGLLDRELRYLRVNEVLARFNGAPVAEHLGRTPDEVIPHAASVVVPLLRRVLETGEAVRDVEIHVPDPRDPSVERFYAVTYDPVRTAEGAVVGIVGTVSDVTALKRAERAARARLDELELIYQNSPVGLAYLDAEMRYVRVNDFLARINGCPVAEHIGRRIDEIAPDLSAQFVPLFGKVLATGQAVLGEELRVAARWDPTHGRTWLTSWHPLKTDTRSVQGVIVVVKDVTALKRRQAELEEVKTRLAKAEQVASVGSWEWDIQQDQVWWSDELYALFRKDPSTFVPDANSFYEHVHPSERSKLREQVEATLVRDEPYRVEFRVIRDDGSERLVRACARLERAPDGIPLRLFGTCQDVAVPVA
jgi:PAS domain S-box-containing protein